MKSNFKFLYPFLAVAGFAWVGCQSKTVPVGAYPAPNTFSDPSVVINFNSGATTTNPALFEIGAPGNTIVTSGAWSQSNNGVLVPLTIAGPGANGTAMASHVTTTVTDLGNGAYPSIQLQGILDGNSKTYNASFFTGIQFYANITSSDTTTARQFYIPTSNTMPAASGGTCVSGCYDNFGYTFTSSTNGWKLFKLDFASLTRGGYGSAITPASFTGANLARVLSLTWQEGRNNVPGTSTVDFWVDEVQFYQ